MELRQSAIRSSSPVFEQSLWACRQWLAREWDKRVISPKLQVALGSTYQGERLVDMFSHRAGDDNSFELPYALMVPQQIGERTEGYNAFALRKIGLATGRVNGGRREQREYLTPVDVGLGVKFVCNDLKEAIVFAQIWRDHRPDARVGVRQKSTGYVFQITIVPDPNVDMPDSDNNERKNIEVMTTLIVKTFSGSTQINKLVTKTTLVIKDRGHVDNLNNDLELVNIESNGFVSTNPRVLDKLRSSSP